MAIRPYYILVTTNGQASALVQFHYGVSPYETIGVLWDTAESYPDLGAFLEEFSAVLESLDIEVNDRGALASLQDGHEMMYQHFNITERGQPYTGVTGTWYCDETDRVYILYLLCNHPRARHPARLAHRVPAIP